MLHEAKARRRMSALAEPLRLTETAVAQATLLYDGACPFCQKSVAMLKKLDWLKAVHYQNCRDTARLPVTNPPLDPKRLIEEMHLVTADRRYVYHGYGAFRWMAWRMPLLWIIAPLLYIPGVPWLGQRIYLWVARNRFKIMPCKDGVCAVSPRNESGA